MSLLYELDGFLFKITALEYKNINYSRIIRYERAYLYRVRFIAEISASIVQSAIYDNWIQYYLFRLYNKNILLWDFTFLHIVLL